MPGKTRIMIYGPKNDGTASETRVIRHFQECMLMACSCQTWTPAAPSPDLILALLGTPSAKLREPARRGVSPKSVRRRPGG
jgi:hypothetical protein